MTKCGFQPSRRGLDVDTPLAARQIIRRWQQNGSVGGSVGYGFFWAPRVIAMRDTLGCPRGFSPSLSV